MFGLVYTTTIDGFHSDAIKLLRDSENDLLFTPSIANSEGNLPSQVVARQLYSLIFPTSVCNCYLFKKRMSYNKQPTLRGMRILSLFVGALN